MFKKEIQMEDVKGLWGKFNDMRKMIEEIKGFSTFNSSDPATFKPPTRGVLYAFGIGYTETIGINVKVKEIERKLNLLVEHLGLEEHKPSCEIQFREKKDDNP